MLHAQSLLRAKFPPHHLNLPNPPHTAINFLKLEVGVLFLGGLPLLCLWATLIFEDILFGFMDT